ncbi:hypothetical protein GGR57DRAFT_488120 [Xylariaceae sp. FL1272]|nr:hypothetical protein GGR57DRAFT_488120 [Xylariaceae sp. FL1272]
MNILSSVVASLGVAVLGGMVRLAKRLDDMSSDLRSPYWPGTAWDLSSMIRHIIVIRSLEDTVGRTQSAHSPSSSDPNPAIYASCRVLCMSTPTATAILRRSTLADKRILIHPPWRKLPNSRPIKRK